MFNPLPITSVLRGISPKALNAIEVTESGIVKTVMSDWKKASEPIVFTPEPNVNEVKAALLNALLPILVTESGMVTEVRPVS